MHMPGSMTVGDAVDVHVFMSVFVLVGLFLLVNMSVLAGMFMFVRMFMPVGIRNRLAVCICMLRALRSLFYIHFLFTGQIRFHLRWNSFIFPYILSLIHWAWYPQSGMLSRPNPGHSG